MDETRRGFFRNAAVWGAGLLGLSKGLSAQETNGVRRSASATASHERSSGLRQRASEEPRKREDAFLPMVTPDVPDAAYETDGGVKVFHLAAEPVKRKIAPFKTIDAWGYNGRCPGPTIQVRQGDRVRVIFENRLPESTSLHWHGLEVPIEQDGVPFISQNPVSPGEKYVYEFTLHQEGTYFYHAHSAMQEIMGMVGFFIAHPA